MSKRVVEIDGGTVLAYGHWGRPVVAFPSENGEVYDWESHGMVAALGGLLDAGKVKLYCVPSFDRETWTRRDLPLWAPGWQLPSSRSQPLRTEGGVSLAGRMHDPADPHVVESLVAQRSDQPMSGRESASSPLWAAREARAAKRRATRREWDSNPRTSCPVIGFQDRPVRPLRHPAGRQGSPAPQANSTESRIPSSSTQSETARGPCESHPKA